LKSGVRVELGPAQGPLNAQLTRERVSELIAQAKNHPGYQAHAERFEFRLRKLDGQAVLELKEKNWASQLKNIFSYSRRSQERQAAHQALSELFHLPAAAQGQQRMDGASARAFAASVPQAVLLQQDLQAGNLSLPERTCPLWAQDLEATRNNSAAQGVDKESGLFQPSADEHEASTLSRRHTRGFTLFMGQFDRSQLPSQEAAPADIGGVSLPPSQEIKRFTQVRKGARRIRHAFNAMRGLSRKIGSEGLELAKRNLMSVAGGAIERDWLASANARFGEKYGGQLSADEASKQMTIEVESNKLSPWGKADEWADVKIRFSGQLNIKGQDASMVQGPLPFHASVHIRLKWEELARPDFKFEGRHVRDFQENLGKPAPRTPPKFPWNA
jgi:hypothetical protein